MTTGRASDIRSRGIRTRLSAEGGFTLVEMLVAMIVLLVGIVATFGVFTSSKNANLVSQRHEVAVHQAQREMESLRSLKYTELGLSSMPQQSSDPTNPNSRLRAGNKIFVKTNPAPCGGGGQPPCNLEEDLVSGGSVDPGPTPFTAGDLSAAVTGKIYRYVSWRDENCPGTICSGNQNTKRLFVAVTIDPVPGRPHIGPKNPVWISSIAIDPNDGPAGGGGGSTPGPSTSAQSFYLYDKRCSDNDADNAYTAPSGSHPWPDPPVGTYDTAAPGTSCENVVADQRPNLMGPAAPTYSNPPNPPYKFSPDIGGTYSAGLALSHAGASTSCPIAAYDLDTTNSDGDNNTSTPGKWQVHAWSTRAFNQEFSLGANAFVSIWTTSVGSLPAAGRFCATLIDRKVVAGVPSDLVVGSMSRTYNPWPTTKVEPGRDCGAADFPCGRQLTFAFTLSGTSVRADSRLVLAISILGSSDKDIVLLYDDPRYRSLVQVETTTPCNPGGTPCSDG